MTWPGTPVDPESPTWNDYQTITAGPIAEADWARYRFAAQEVIRDVTWGQSEETTDEDELARIEKATYIVADALYAAETGVQSESLGSYSYSRAQTYTRADAPRVAIRALSGTGLTYRGF